MNLCRNCVTANELAAGGRAVEAADWHADCKRGSCECTYDMDTIPCDGCRGDGTCAYFPQRDYFKPFQHIRKVSE